jgi:hypothetical protein
MNARLFSRHLPPTPSYPIRPLGWLFLACLAVGLVALIYYDPIPILGSLVFLTVGGRIASRIETRRKLALASFRPGNPLCGFARSMDLRSVDPWVVRAAFEELQPYFPQQARPFPIHPADRLVDDFHIDPDDIEDIARDIAASAGYSLDHTERNPLYGRVDTVGNLIQFFTHQPKTRNT